MALLDGLRQGIGKRLLSSELSELKREFDQNTESLDHFQESMAELELFLEDTEWIKMSIQGEREFSRDGLRKITQMARMMYLKNPLINRGVEVQKFYVWAQGISVQAKHAEINEVLQDFIDDEKNQAEFTSHQARMRKEVELQTDGNIFFVFFPNIYDGRVRMRSVPFDQIEEIISNPEDSKEPWFYKRIWTERPFRPGLAGNSASVVRRIAYYPDWRYTPAQKTLRSIGGNPIFWESPIYHVRVGGFSDWRFGISAIYAAIDWGRAYKEFLEDVATLMRAYSRFAHKLSTKGGKRGIAKAKSKFATTLGSSGGTGAETNPSPNVGSMFIGGEGVDLTPMNIRGASISPDDGRRLLLMVAAAVGLPETFFGDASVGSLATAKALDRPTELMMRDQRTLWADVYRGILDYVVLWAVKAPAGALSGLAKVKQTLVDQQIDEKILWRKDAKGNVIDGRVDVDFPPLIEDDVSARVEAISQAATLSGMPMAGTIGKKELSKMLLIALGEDDVDEMVELMFPQGEENDLGNLPEMGEAVSKLREVVENMHERWNGRKVKQ